MKFQRETATHASALPHEFEVAEDLAASVCEVCQGSPHDPRHRAWERQQLAERERAQMHVEREIGS